MEDSKLYDVAIIGSGPSGASAATGLKGLDVLMLDVGYDADPSSKNFNKNLSHYKSEKNESSELLLGRNFESLNNISYEYLMPKIKSPFNRYVTKSIPMFGSVESHNFNAQMSYAKGGLANIWGAQLLRYDDFDLRGFPIYYDDLKAHYSELEREIGISGENDDLETVYGNSDNLMPPLKKNIVSTKVLAAYKKKKDLLLRCGFKMGSPRLCVLSKPMLGRNQAEYNNLEFFKPQIESNYTPVYTINALLKERLIEYLSGYYVESLNERTTKIEICTKNILTNLTTMFYAKKVIVCAGAINSAKLILKSRKDYKSKLSIMDNGLSLIPFIHLKSIGTEYEHEAYYNQLCLTYQDATNRIIGSFYSLTAALFSDLIFDLPFPSNWLQKISAEIFPSMLVLHLWYPEKPSTYNQISLKPDNTLIINYPKKNEQSIEKNVIRNMLKIGLFSHSKLVRYPKSGNSFHYSGTLPMKDKPLSHYETWPNGLLNGSNNIYIADGSVFPLLPAKNLSFTIMANALRISKEIKWTMQHA